MDLCRAMGWLSAAQYRQSPRAKPKALTAWHDPLYIEALMRAEETQDVDDATRARHGLGTVANPVFPEMYRRPATGAGGALLAVELLRAGGVVFHPGGGTHHGLPDRANGFCYLNDPALAITALRQQGLTRIAYVDMDAHHPDGVEHGFKGASDVLMISVHEERRWPFTGALDDDGGGNCLNLPVPRGFHDAEMALIRDMLILPALAAFSPEAIVLQCGADAVTDDPLSRLCLSAQSYWDMVAAIQSLRCPRLLVTGGGGYNPWTVARVWSGIWAKLSGQDIPDRLPQEGEAILRGLSWAGHSKGKSPPATWFTQLHDNQDETPIRDTIRNRIALLSARPAAQGVLP
jgi:acetoin utilization protein AcuC